MIQHNFIHKGLTIGIIFLFISIAFLPSLSNVKAYVEKINSLQSPPKWMNKYHIKNVVGFLYIEHKLLEKIIGKLNYIRGSVLDFLFSYSVDFFHHYNTIIHPLVFFFAIVLAIRIGLGIQFWLDISNYLQWGWTYDELSNGW